MENLKLFIAPGICKRAIPCGELMPSLYSSIGITAVRLVDCIQSPYIHSKEFKETVEKLFEPKHEKYNRLHNNV